MNCEQFQAVLDLFLQGRAEDRTAARSHLERCPGCRDLVDLLRGDLVLPDVPAPEGLAEAVLARTSGPACQAACRSIPDQVDGVLAADDSGLLSLHLEGCRACRKLAGAVRLLAVDLPALAEMEPEAGFTARVLAATSACPRFGARLAAWWQAWLARPRFAFESAYIAAVAITLLLGLPFGGRITGKMQDLAGLQPVRTFVSMEGPVAAPLQEAVAWAGGVGEDTARETMAQLAGRAQEVTGWLRGQRDDLKNRWMSGDKTPDQPRNGNVTKENEP